MADNNERNSGNSSSSGETSYIDILKRRLAEKTKASQTEHKINAAVEERSPKKVQKEETRRESDDSKSWRENIKKDNRSAKKVKQAGEGKEKKLSVSKMLGIIALSTVLGVVLIVGGYFAYLQATYSRIADMKYLSTENNQLNRLAVGQEYSISTFNIGFGAYSQSFSFFMDEGEMINGTKTKGKSAKALSEEDVNNNIAGAINLIKNQSQSDFYFFQEVDTDSTRSYYVNQVDLINQAFENYASVFAENAHSKYLFYPLSDPIGKINSGILTLSRYNVDYSVRRSLVIETGMVNKLFDLDRCFSVTKLPIYGTSKYLVLINVHLSAYDDGDIRNQQIAALYKLMDYEYNTNGNYVVVGGDFNLCLAGEDGIFNNQMKTPSWCKPLPEGYTADNFAFIGYSINYDLSTTIGTCRDASMKYSEGVNLEVIIDGFITSGNITVSSTSIIDGKFKNSDHNPVRMEFVLN